VWSIIVLISAARPLGVNARFNLRRNSVLDHTSVITSGLPELNQQLAQAIDERDVAELDCSSQAEATRAQKTAIEIRLSRAKRSLQAMAAAEVHVQAHFGFLSNAASTLETQRDELELFCRQLDEHRQSQRVSINPVEDLAAQVMVTAAKLVGDFSAKVAQIQGSHVDQKAMLNEMAKACSDQAVVMRYKFDTTKTAAIAFESQLRALEQNKKALENSWAALNSSNTEVQKQQVAQQKECDEYALGKQKTISELRSERASALPGVLLTDCEVSRWRATGSCSKECMGGTQQVTREVLRHPNAGILCPKLISSVACNTQRCPVACQLGAWSAWSPCSAKCNGGYRIRNRTITTSAAHDADLLQVQENPAPGASVPVPASAMVAAFDAADKLACGLAQEVETCNPQACGDVCVYGEWGLWGACTKACGGGTRLRRRKKIPVDESLAAVCDGYDTELGTCKEQLCPPSDKPRMCNAKMDIVFLIDTSELIDKSDLDIEKKIVRETIDKFALDRENGAVVGLVMYGAWAPKGVLTLPLTDSRAALESRIDHVGPGRGGLRLDIGLDSAWTMMKGWFSRPGTYRTVVILLKDRPDSASNSVVKARILKDAGIRVVVAVAGSCIVNKRTLQQIASEPTAENIFFYKSFQELHTKLDEQFVRVCPHLEGDSGHFPEQAHHLPPSHPGNLSVNPGYAPHR
jgi:hypothetical protein